MQSSRSRPHTAALRSEISYLKPSTQVTHNGKTLCHLKIGATFFLDCISNHKVKDCFPFVQTLAAGLRCAATPQGWSSETPAALNQINKITFLSLIFFMSGWTVGPLLFCFCLCSITRATGERQHLLLYVFYLKEETAMIPAASLMLLCSECRCCLHGILWCFFPLWTTVTWKSKIKSV